MYKAILLNEGEKFDGESLNKLNKYFDEAWEYVDSITQSISGGGYVTYSRTIVILKLKEQSNVI
jgi:hypothetical protein